MKFLVVSQDSAARKALSSMLSGGTHVLDHVTDADVALLRLASSRPDCVITDWFIPGMDGVELTRRVRALAGNAISVVVMCELSDAGARAHVQSAGADLYLVKPLYAQQVLGALASLRKQASAAGVSAARAVLQERLMQQSVWTEFERLATECLQGCTGMAFRRSGAASPVARDSDVCASIGMIDSATRAEVHYSIRLDRGSGASLSNVMLGTTHFDDESLIDLAGELCNNLLGQSKTMLRPEGFEFSLGVAGGADKSRALPQDVAISKCLVLQWPSGTMTVSIGLRATQATLVRARDLSEHMVVVEDVKTAEGALLVPSGTRLTAVTAERLMRRLPNHEFRVATVGA